MRKSPPNTRKRWPAKTATALLAVLISQSGCFTFGPRFLLPDWRPAVAAFDVGIEVSMPTRDDRCLATTYSYALGHASGEGEPDVDFGIHEVAVGGMWTRDVKAPRRKGSIVYPGRRARLPGLKYTGVGGWVASGEYSAGAGREQSWSAGVYAHCGYWRCFYTYLAGFEARARLGAPFNFGGTSRSTASLGIYMVVFSGDMVRGVLDGLTR